MTGQEEGIAGDPQRAILLDWLKLSERQVGLPPLLNRLAQFVCANGQQASRSQTPEQTQTCWTYPVWSGQSLSLAFTRRLGHSGTYDFCQLTVYDRDRIPLFSGGQTRDMTWHGYHSETFGSPISNLSEIELIQRNLQRDSQQKPVLPQARQAVPV